MRRAAAVARRLSTAAEAGRVDGLLKPPTGLPVSEQLALLRADDAERGKRRFALPEERAPAGSSWASWGDYFCTRGWDADCLHDRLLLQTLTGALSCPLTTWAALRHFGLLPPEEAEPAAARTEVHIIGAADSHEGALLGAVWPWVELAELLPPSADATLALIGPDLDATSRRHLGASGVVTSAIGGARAPQAPSVHVADNLGATCHVADDYARWRADAAEPPPTLALAFNSGAGTDGALWRDTVAMILDEGTPAVFTSFDDVDAAADGALLDQMGAARTTAANPFASALPEVRAQCSVPSANAALLRECSTGAHDSIRHDCGGASQVRTGKQGEGATGATRIGYANAVWHLVRGRVATARHHG